MRHTVLAAEHPAGAVARTIARGVAARGFCGFQYQIERDAEAAAIFAVAAGVFAEFVPAKMQGKPHLRDLQTAEFETADAVPFADRGIAVAAG